MGCGVAKQLVSLEHRPAIRLTAHRDLVGNTVNVIERDLETESFLDSEMDAMCSEMLQQYTQNHSEFTKDLKAVFHSVEKLQRLSHEEHAFGDKIELSKINKEILKLRKRSIKAAFSPGTPDEQKYNIIANFIVDLDAAVLFYLLIEHLFDSYLSCAKEQRRDGVKTGKQSIAETDSLDQLSSESLILILLVVQNFAEFHEQFCVACTSKTGVVLLCLTKSKEVEDVFKYVDNDGSGRPVRAIRILGCCLNVLYNLGRKTELVKEKVDFEGKETLVYFAKSDIAIVSPLALLSLAYVVDEESNHLILADEEILVALTSLLQKACESGRRKFDGFSAKELAEGLSRLAINDINKKVLGKKGAISVLVSMIKISKDDGEKASATKALWMLAFDEDNKKLIKQESGALDVVSGLQHSNDPSVQKAAAGALWEIEGKNFRTNVKNESSGNHVMISYQWDNQQMLVEVKNKLQALGYRVWMDLEQMGGSTLEAMAKAVENASVVLICVSQKYKESPNCRSEAEYAYQLRKDIIPLMMQRDYRPDGWLGMILGTKLWIDLRNNHNLVTGMEKLMKELGDRGLDNQGNEALIAEQGEECGCIQEKTPGVPGIVEWTANEVECWLKDIGLNEVCKAALPRMDGQILLYLHALRNECPDYFYKCLETNLNLRNMFDLFKFREELTKLMQK